MLRTHIIGALCATVIGALINPFMGQETSSSRPGLPHFVSAKADDSKAKAEVDEGLKGSGYQYADPLAERVDDLEKRTETIEKSIGLAKAKTDQASTSAAPEVKSTTTVESSSSKSNGAVTVRAGASPEEVANSLNALGYKVNYSGRAYSAGGGSSGGGMSTASYGSSGSSSYSYSYPVESSYYAAPVYQAPAYQAQVQYSAPVQYATPYYPVKSARSGLFGRNYSAPTCRTVNGQVICN